MAKTGHDLPPDSVADLNKSSTGFELKEHVGPPQFDERDLVVHSQRSQPQRASGHTLNVGTARRLTALNV